MKKFISCLLAASMLVMSTAALAAAPSDYDGQSYAGLGYTSDDPDGQFNLAVIANGDVNIYGDTMYIQGSVYSNGTIYAGNGQGNKVDGLFISGTENTVFGSDDNNDEWTQYRTAEGFVHVNDYGNTDGINYYSTQIEHEGAILDKNTSFECSYEPFEIPTISNDIGDAEFNVYGYDGSGWGDANTTARTISENTKIGALKMNGSYGPALTVDTTNGPVNIVIDEITSDSQNINIKVVGDNDANIYIGSLPANIPVIINYDNTVWPMEISGSVEKTHLYLGSDTVISASKIAVADMKVTADSLEISGATTFTGNIESNASSFTITGGQTEVTGIVCVPNADSEVVDSGTLYGQLHTNTLTINGAGRILWKADTAVAKAEVEETPEPTEEPTPAPVPEDDEIDLYGLGYAYIFGYEPKISYEPVTDEDGNYVGGQLIAEVEMAPNDAVTREQVAAMIMRMIDQNYDSMDAVYPVTDNISAHEGTWYERGLAYLASKGAFDGIDSVEIGPVTRGEVAKLVVFGLNLKNTGDVDFTDISGHQYEDYIKIMCAYGYMQGMGDGQFMPDKIMTRAEYCSMFNQIIGRDQMGLTAQDGAEVTPELYSIVDLNDGAWYVDVMMKATSAYDSNGLIDTETRLSNIRNVLDNYDAQKWF